MKTKTNRREISVAGAPDIPGLTFRGFRGEADYPAMLAVIEASKQADGLEPIRLRISPVTTNICKTAIHTATCCSPRFRAR